MPLNLKSVANGSVILTPASTAVDKNITIPATDGTMVVQDGTNTTTLTNVSYSGTLTGGTGVINIGSGQFYKDASGNVGIGTVSPVAKLDVNGASGVTSFTGTTRLGVTVRGSISTNDYSGIDFTGTAVNGPTARIAVLSGSSGSSLQFGTSSSYVSGITNTAMTIDSSGNVGIGTASPQSKLAVFNSGAAGFEFFTNYPGGGVGTYIQSYNRSSPGYVDTAYDALSHSFRISGTERARIDSSGNLLVGTTIAVANTRFTVERISGAGNQAGIGFSSGGTAKWKIGNNNSDAFIVYNTSDTGVYLNSGGTSWTATSDERAKDIIELIENAATKVATLRAVIGKYKTDDANIRRPFLIAQDVQKVLPEAVNEGDGSGMLGLQYTDVIPLLVAAIQELKAEIDLLKGN